MLPDLFRQYATDTQLAKYGVWRMQLARRSPTLTESPTRTRVQLLGRMKINMAWIPLVEGQAWVSWLILGILFLRILWLIIIHIQAQLIYFYPCAHLSYHLLGICTPYSDTCDPSCCPQAPAYYNSQASTPGPITTCQTNIPQTLTQRQLGQTPKWSTNP